MGRRTRTRERAAPRGVSTPGDALENIDELVSSGGQISVGQIPPISCAAIANDETGEARGFLFGAAMAAMMGLGVVPVRKAGKLPGVTIGVDYKLEYGSDRLELHEGAVGAGDRVVLVDDLLATGGTILATAELMRAVGADVAAALFVIDLPDLGGSARLAAGGVTCETLIAFAGD